MADAFEAMTASRPYRRALSHDEALAELRACAGTQFDPRVVEAFALILGREEAVVPEAVDATPAPGDATPAAAD